MKKNIFTVILSLTISFGAFASANSTCESAKQTKLEFIQAIASSEALAILQGPHRDVSVIEVFAMSNDGLHAKTNIIFSGTIGNSKPVTLNVLINCDAGGVLELEGKY